MLETHGVTAPNGSWFKHIPNYTWGWDNETLSAELNDQSISYLHEQLDLTVYRSFR